MGIVIVWYLPCLCRAALILSCGCLPCESLVTLVILLCGMDSVLSSCGLCLILSRNCLVRVLDIVIRTVLCDCLVTDLVLHGLGLAFVWSLSVFSSGLILLCDYHVIVTWSVLCCAVLCCDVLCCLVFSCGCLDL